MKPIKKAVATVGKYTKNGQEKNRYLTIGQVMQRDDGSMCLKLDSVPVGPEFSGWINFYDLDNSNQAAPQQASADVDSDLPF